ncbi:MAG: (d)CMP kinase [Ignavibacteriae bacterium]|nr:(d)CMP kinase [Ignavibacteriota bacterium]
MKKVVITIDGPTGTGKSTTAKLLANKLKFDYIDSGFYYRAITHQALLDKLKPNDIHKLSEMAKKINLEFRDDSVFMNGEEVTETLRSFDITNKVAGISKIKQLRKIVNDKLKNYHFDNGLVIDGKDMCTNVFPDANAKFYLVCDFDARVARRQQEFLDHGHKIMKDKIALELKKRDEIDLKHTGGVTRKTQDIIEVDTTNMIIEEQVDFLYRKILSLNILNN